MAKRTVKRSSCKKVLRKPKKATRKTHRKRGGVNALRGAVSLLPGMRGDIDWSKPFSTRRKLEITGTLQVYNLTWEPTTPGIATDGTLTLDFSPLGTFIVENLITKKDEYGRDSMYYIYYKICAEFNQFELLSLNYRYKKGDQFYFNAHIPMKNDELRKTKLIFTIKYGGIVEISVLNTEENTKKSIFNDAVNDINNEVPQTLNNDEITDFKDMITDNNKNSWNKMKELFNRIYKEGKLAMINYSTTTP